MIDFVPKITYSVSSEMLLITYVTYGKIQLNFANSIIIITKHVTNNENDYEIHNFIKSYVNII